MKQFKKLYLLLLLCVISFTSTNAKNIFYPVYINHVEHYKDNVLVGTTEYTIKNPNVFHHIKDNSF